MDVKKNIGLHKEVAFSLHNEIRNLFAGWADDERSRGRGLKNPERDKRAQSEIRLRNLKKRSSRPFRIGSYIEMKILSGRFKDIWISGKIVRLRPSVGLKKYDVEILDHCRWHTKKRVSAVSQRNIRAPLIFKSLEDSTDDVDNGEQIGTITSQPPQKTSSFRPGDFVQVDSDRRGVIKYVGKLQGVKGIYFGIELLNGQGEHNGTYKNTTYFSCPANKGIFVLKKSKSKASHTNNVDFVSAAPVKNEEILVGSLVVLKDERIGIVRYKGYLDLEDIPVSMRSLKDSEFIGIELQKSGCGKHDGKKYFNCLVPGNGLFVLPKKVDRVVLTEEKRIEKIVREDLLKAMSSMNVPQLESSIEKAQNFGFDEMDKAKDILAVLTYESRLRDMLNSCGKMMMVAGPAHFTDIRNILEKLKQEIEVSKMLKNPPVGSIRKAQRALDTFGLQLRINEITGRWKGKKSEFKIGIRELEVILEEARAVQNSSTGRSVKTECGFSLNTLAAEELLACLKFKCDLDQAVLNKDRAGLERLIKIAKKWGYSADKASSCLSDIKLEESLIRAIKGKDMKAMACSLSAALANNSSIDWAIVIKKHVAKFEFKKELWDLAKVILKKWNCKPYFLLVNDRGEYEEAEISALSILSAEEYTQKRERRIDEPAAQAKVKNMKIPEDRFRGNSVWNSLEPPIRTQLRERYTKSSETKRFPSALDGSSSNNIARKQKSLAKPTSNEAKQFNDEEMEIGMGNDNRFNVANVRSIIKAWYGSELNKWTKNEGYDVTELVREYLIGTTLLTAKLDFGDFGEDPAPGSRKVLLVRFRSVQMNLLSPRINLKRGNLRSLEDERSRSSDVQLKSPGSNEKTPDLQKAVVDQYEPQDIIGVSKSCLQGFYGSDNAHSKTTAADVTEELLAMLDGSTLRLSKWSNLDSIFPYFDSKDHGRRSLILHYLPYRPKHHKIRTHTNSDPQYITPYLNKETIKQHNSSNIEENYEIDSIVDFETRSRVARGFEPPNIQHLEWQLGRPIHYLEGHANDKIHKGNRFLYSGSFADGDVCEGYSDGVWSKVKILNTNTDGSYDIRWLKNNRKALSFTLLRPSKNITKDVSNLNEQQLYERLIQLHIPVVFAKMLLDCHVTGNDLQSMDHSDLECLGIRNPNLRDKIFNSMK